MAVSTELKRTQILTFDNTVTT